MATNPDTEYREVYRFIQELAARCDGAVTLDGMGFNGQDTKFGRRIASVPFEQWTEDVKQEAARICLTYKQQIIAYTGIDPATLDVVRQANGLGTNHQARWDARKYEKRAKAAEVIAQRTVLAHKGQLVLKWAKRGDPDFEAMKDAARALPTRRFDWDIQGWVTPVSEEAEDIILSYDFNVTDEARALLQAPRQAPAIEYNVNVDEASGRLTIKAPYTNDKNVFNARVADARMLPGREWSPPGFDKVDVVNATPQVIEYATKWNLTIHPDVYVAIEAAHKALEAASRAAMHEEDFRTLMVHVSRLRSPEQLPPAFLEMLEEVLDA